MTSRIFIPSPATNQAPFSLSDNRDGVTRFGYNNVRYPGESVDLRNAVYAIPGMSRSRGADTITETAVRGGTFDVTAVIHCIRDLAFGEQETDRAACHGYAKTRFGQIVN